MIPWLLLFVLAFVVGGSLPILWYLSQMTGPWGMIPLVVAGILGFMGAVLFGAYLLVSLH